MPIGGSDIAPQWLHSVYPLIRRLYKKDRPFHARNKTVNRMTSPNSSRSRSSSSPTSALPPPYTFTTFVYEPTSAIVGSSPFGAAERHVSPTTPTSLIALPSPPPAPPEPFLPRVGSEPTVI